MIWRQRVIRLQRAGSSLCAALILAGCSGAQSPGSTAESELAEQLAAVNDQGDGLPEPELSVTWAGQPFLAQAEESCLLRRAPDSGARQFVLTFQRDPDDALVLHVAEGVVSDEAVADAPAAETAAPEMPVVDGRRAIERGWFVAENDFRTLMPAALESVRIEALDDGWLLDGRFELDVPPPADAPAGTPPERVTGQFARLFCLDLDRLKAAAAGPATTSP